MSVVTGTATVAAKLVGQLAFAETLDLGRSRPTKRWIDLRPTAPA
jgi:hypothetical protein